MLVSYTVGNRIYFREDRHLADKQKLLTVSIPVVLHQAAKLAALKRGITLREMVIKGLQAQVKRGRA
jgi:predicted HicB family RNase H-like nuclease